MDEEQFKKILGYISTGQREGAKLLCGGNPAADRGYFIQPTVFGDVQDSMTIAREEVSAAARPGWPLPTSFCPLLMQNPHQVYRHWLFMPCES